VAHVLSRDLSQQLVGVVGAIHVARFAWLSVTVMPERAFALAVIYLAIALVALVPAFGLVAHKPLGRTWWVLAFVIDALITLALIV
jgi:hypothetical protein